MAAKDGTLRKRNTFDSCHARAAFVRTLVVDCRLGILGNGTSPARWDDRGPADPKPRGPPRVPPRVRGRPPGPGWARALSGPTAPHASAAQSDSR